MTNTARTLLTLIAAALILVAPLGCASLAESATNPSDPLTLGVKALAPLIPAPIQAPLVLGAALAATLARSGALKRSASSIIESIEHAKRKDDGFREAIERNADAIRTIQTPGARKLVKKAKG